MISSSPDSHVSRRAVLLATAALTAPLAGCSGVGLLNGFTARDSYQLDGGIAYGADPRQRLDVYRPLASAPSGAAGWPTVVFFYGGNWTHGDRADYRFVGEALAARGVVAVVADYRLSPRVRWRDILADCAAATKWAFDRAAAFGADPSRIHLMGHSAGAYNAAMLALDPRWLAAQGLKPAQLAGWIGLAGPYDFLPITEPMTRVAFDWPDTPADSQPIRHASAAAPRTLLLAAAKDDTVNPQRSTVQLGEKLRAAGVATEVELLDRVGHATLIGAVAGPLRSRAPVLDRVLAFVGAPRAA